MVNDDHLHGGLPAAAEAIEAEQELLGAMLNAPRAVAGARLVLEGTEFYQPRHQLIFEAILAVADSGLTVETVVVADMLQKRNQLTKVGGHVYMFDLFQRWQGAANAMYYAELVRRAWKYRTLLEISNRLHQQMSSASSLDVALDFAAQASVKLDEQVDELAPGGQIDGLSDWEEFLSTGDTHRRWIVENLFEEQDVWMILAAGGSGKSWLSRQICLAIASGVHPFRPLLPIPPQRTLLIDLEVSDSMLRAQTQPVLEQVYALGESVADRGFVWRKQEGLNLRLRSDALLLERVIQETEPKLVAIGSLYKAFQKGNSDWDTASEETRAVFDRIRKKYGVCWWIEHHMNRGNGGAISGTPYGGATWDKWPTHGRTLTRVEGVPASMHLFSFAQTWRGDRDVREVPEGLKRSTRRLPWEAISASEIEAAKEGAGLTQNHGTFTGLKRAV